MLRTVSPRPDPTLDGSWAFLAPSALTAHDLPSQAALGFHRGRTEELLSRAAATIGRLNRELAELQQAREEDALERDRLEVSLDEERKRAELLVGEAMVDAHKAGQAIKAEAKAEGEQIRADARAQIGAAQQKAEQLVADARVKAQELVADARAESERLALQSEQYKLLAAEVQRRSVGVLQCALEALEEGAASAGSSDEVTPFRTTDLHAEEIPEAAAR
jgi:F0F1-type ATP synthase membrane subunit b/b'